MLEEVVPGDREASLNKLPNSMLLRSPRCQRAERVLTIGLINDSAVLAKTWHAWTP